ncbi:MAG: DUF4159 domain-containing protein [Planctomycetota bacterium]|nr:DUF4159 domain-containing protein [Planctomycetota bacterium]
MTLVRCFLCIGVCLAVSSVAGGEDADITPEQVAAAVGKGSEAALRNLERYQRTADFGSSVLCAMALLNAGVTRENPTLNAAINRIVRDADKSLDPYAGPYQAGLVCMMLHMLKDQTYRRVAERMAHALQNRQSPNGGWGDNSRTQFALLGLKAAQDLGVRVPPDVFKRARRYVEGGQLPDGSWGYTPGEAASRRGSMTAAGITSLFIINEQATKESVVCGAAPSDARIQKALGWLGERFTVRANPGCSAHHFYYLYALERIGVLTGQKYIGGHDWYREGAQFLVGCQSPDGTWRESTQWGTEFALLFLGKGREPIVIQKLRHNGEWNTDPYDAKDLVEQASRDLKMPMTCQVVDTQASAAMLAAAPILYLQGHGALGLSRAAREAIKAFVEQGGFVFGSACCGDSDFDKSFRAEMALMFPDATFAPLPAGHEVFSIRHPIATPSAFMLEGLNTGCRTSVLYAPHDLCCGWGSCKGCTDKAGVESQDALNLGVNMIAYALDFKKMRDKLDEPAITIGRADAPPPRETLLIGQLYHGGDWNPDPASIPNLGKTLKEQTGCTTEFGKRRAVPGTDDLGDFPLLYLTGHREFQFQPAQVEALRAYLDRGGFLLAEPCCGKAEFDAAFRRFCTQLYPDRPLTRLAPDHPVLRAPYEIDKVKYKPAVKKQFPAVGDAPQVEGITAPDGRLQVFYSRFNFGCELQGHGCAHCLGIEGDDAYHLAVNAVLYALSH